MKHSTLSMLFLFLINLSGFAEQISETTAKIVGINFITTTSNSDILKNSRDLELVFKAVSTSGQLKSTSSEITLFYVFNTSAPGFVIVAGDDNVTPILAYSDEGTFDPDNMPDNVKKWLEAYKKQVQHIITHGIKATKSIQSEWTAYQNGLSARSANLEYVAPLVKTQWGQHPYYNDLCPDVAVAGCVATAMAQIMKYWNFPATGSGFHSYNHHVYGTLSAFFGDTNYDWTAMPDIVNAPNSAVATLIYHCGVSVNMNYGPKSSGAFVISDYSASENCAEYALKSHFGYKKSLKGIQRINYSQEHWNTLLKNELKEGRPVLYSGFGTGSGHAFVCDGYDSNNFFHFNWGWDGAFNGYFYVNALNPEGVGTGKDDFSSRQMAVIGIEPSSPLSLTESYDIRLYSNINMASQTIWFRKPFDVTVAVGNWGSADFTGEIGAAVYDADKKFLTFLGIKELNLTGGYYQTLTFSHDNSPRLVSGTYYLALFYRVESGNWTAVKNGNYRNLLQFQIEYSATIETYSAFTISQGELVQGETATINVDILNTGNVMLDENFRISLSKLNGDLAQNIQVRNTLNNLPPNHHYIGGVNFTGTITVEPGTYLLELAYQTRGTNEWYYAGSSYYPNPVYVIVRAQSAQPDVYEENNTAEEAYHLPLAFSDNHAQINTNGSNIHTERDVDYYKLHLPQGNDYIVRARLHDSYNSDNGYAYSLDAMFSYALDSKNWSGTYDDVMNTEINISNGGTLYFKVEPFYATRTGTYLLDIAVERLTKVSIGDIPKNAEVKIFPNPASENLYIDFSNADVLINNVELLNIQGQVIASKTVSNNNTLINMPLHGISSGTYLIRISCEQNVIIQKIIIRK